MLRMAAPTGVTLLVLVLTWSIGTPRYAAPDEPAHAQKAFATADGQTIGVPVPGSPSNLRQFDGPGILGPGNIGCFARVPEQPASCATPADDPLISSAALYPPYYYGIVGLPAAAVGRASSVATMRAASAVFAVLVLTAALVLLLRSSRREWAVPMTIVAVTPMALSLMGAINPNGAEIAMFVLLWALTLRLLTDAQASPRWMVAWSSLAGFTVMMRPSSAVSLAGLIVIAAVACSPTRRRELTTRPMLIRLAVPMVVAAAAAFAWQRYSAFRIEDDRVGLSGNIWEAIVDSIGQWGEYLRQSVGVLGWLDTTLPFLTYVLWIVAVAVAVVCASVAGSGRRRLILPITFVAFWLAMPLAINGVSGTRAGLVYQGRYGLPFLVGVGVLAALSQCGPKAPSWIWAVPGLLVVAEVMAFWQMLRRFSVGASGKVWLVEPLPWSPRVTPMLLIASNALAMSALVVVLARQVRAMSAAEAAHRSCTP